MYSGTRGPGTFVVTVWSSCWGNRIAVREPSASSVGAAKLPALVSTSAPAAWRLPLRSSICSRIVDSRSNGSSELTGRLTSTALTRLSSRSCSFSARIDTGTIVRTTWPSTSSPRLASSSRNPCVMAVRMTSLTVPPVALRIRLTSARSALVHTHRRCGPIGPFSEPAADEVRRLAVPGRLPSTARPMSSSSDPLRRLRANAGMAARCFTGVHTASRTPSTTRSSWEGLRCGVHSVGSGSATSLRASSSSCIRSVPATPSIRQWWTLEMIAQRLFSRPSTSQISHSGLVRSRRCANSLPARLRSWSSPPGEGTAVCRTW